MPHLKRLTLTVVFIVSPVVSLSRVSPSLLHLLALRYRKPACATLAASLTMAHCLVQLNSYTISALSLAHHSPISSPPPASIAAGTRHESRSQACGSREVDVRTQQSANACKVSGRALTSFKSARVYERLHHPVPPSTLRIWYRQLKGGLLAHLGNAAQSNEDATKRHQSEGPDPPSNSRHHPKRQNLHPHRSVSGSPPSPAVYRPGV